MFEILLAFSDHQLAGEWTEVHPGVRYESTEYPLMAAFFLNSEGNPSLAVGFHGDYALSDTISAFGEIGGATGYSGGPVIPFGRAGFEYSDMGRLFVAPAMTTDGDIGTVVGVELILARF